MIPIPEAGQTAWLHLAGVLAELDTTPCTSQPDDWWPANASATTTGPAAACRDCPARGACLDYALAADERYGIWGGTTPADRSSTRGGTS